MLEFTDQAFARVQPLLPGDSRCGKPWRDHRQVLGGILWKMHTGRPWRDVPERFGPWQTCYGRLRRWQRDGTWAGVWAVRQIGHHGHPGRCAVLALLDDGTLLGPPASPTLGATADPAGGISRCSRNPACIRGLASSSELAALAVACPSASASISGRVCTDACA